MRFQPLTDGLGFHPFADGLPYAPAGKSNASAPSGTPTTGSGAVAAGRPQFVYPSPAVTAAARTASRATAPKLPALGSTVDETVDRIRRELESIQTDRIEQARAHVAEVKALQSGVRVVHGFGYCLERIFAYFLDSAFNLSICASVLSTALLSTDLDHLRTLTPLAAITVAVFLFLCNWALMAAQEVAFGTTIGKRIFGLRLGGTGFECFVRALYFLPSLLFFGLGVLVAIFDARKRCWHDRMTKLQPEN